MQSKRNVLIVKLVSAIILLTVTAADVLVIGYRNPTDPVILGRYALPDFVLLLGLLLATAGWAVFTIWIVLRFDAERLANFNRALHRRPRLVFGTLAVLSLAVVVVTYIAQREVQAFSPIMQFLPLVEFALLCAGLSAALDSEWRSEFEEHVGKWLIPLMRKGLLIGLVVAIIVAAAIYLGLSTYPITKDTSKHIYLGQATLSGLVPYRDTPDFHPPLRIVVSMAWTLLGRLLGVSAAEGGRIIAIGLGTWLVYVTYQMGKDLTGSVYGGIVAALVLLQMELFYKSMIRSGPNMKFVIGSAVATAILLAQRRRWLTAGVMASAASLMWLPAGAAAIGISLAALGQPGKDRWRAVVRVVVGGIGLAVVAVIALAVLGVLPLAFDQVVLSAFQLAGNAGGDSGSLFASIYDVIVSWAPKLGGIIIVLLAVAGLLISGLRAKLREALTDSRRSALILSLLLLFVVIGLDKVNGGDVVVEIGLFAALASVPIIHLLNRGRAARSLELMGGWLVVSLLVFRGVLAITANPWPDSDPPVTMEGQRARAANLEAVLGPDDSVQSFGDLWYQVIAQRTNPLPVINIDRKNMLANESLGWGEAEIVEELREQAPAIIMYSRPTSIPLAQVLQGEYISYGQMDVGVSNSRETILVRADRPDVQAVIEGWETAR